MKRKNYFMNRPYDPELLAALKKWHDQGRHKRIIETVETVARDEWDYGMASCYARALNNVNRYWDALNILLSVRGQGEQDCYWHYRVGYSLYYLDQMAAAALYLKKAVDLGDEHDNTKYLLTKSLIRAWAEEDVFNPLALVQEPEIRKLFNPRDFLFVFISKYLRVIEENPDDGLARCLHVSQRALLAYYSFSDSPKNGGFIQFIQFIPYGSIPYSGREGFIFDPLFVETLRAFGAGKAAGIVQEVQNGYTKYAGIIQQVQPGYIRWKKGGRTRSKETAKVFPELYPLIQDFELLEAQFLAVSDGETKNIQRYVEEHIREFSSFKRCGGS
jgi:hypothetical protein